MFLGKHSIWRTCKHIALITNWTFTTVKTWIFMNYELYNLIPQMIRQYVWDFVFIPPAKIAHCLFSNRSSTDELWLTCDEDGTSPSSAGPEAVISRLSWWTASHSWWVPSVKYRRGQTQHCNQYKQSGVVVTHLGIEVKLQVKFKPVMTAAWHLHLTLDAVHRLEPC